MRGVVSGHKTRRQDSHTRIHEEETEDHGEPRADATVERSTVHVDTHERLRGMFASSISPSRVGNTTYGAVGGGKNSTVEKTMVAEIDTAEGCR